jgi:O-acetylserine/cysteine efflux transporter
MTINRRLVFPALLAAGVLWGTTVPLSKVALGWLPPAWLAFARFALAAVVLMAASRHRLRAAARPAILITGAIGYGGSVLLQNIGIERTSVMHAALLIGATPVLVAIMAAVLGHSVARPLAWAGFALSLAGVGFIAGGHGSGSSLAGDALVVAAQLISAAFTVSQARLLRGHDPIAVTGLQLMAAACAVLPIALLTEHQVAGPAGPGSVLATADLVLAGTVLPTSLFAFGQSRVSADVAGAFLNLEPLVGAILGMALFAEPAGKVQLAGGSAIVIGIGLSSVEVVRTERRVRTGPRHPSAPTEELATGGVLVTAPAGGTAPTVRNAASGDPMQPVGRAVPRSVPARGATPGVVTGVRFARARPPGVPRPRRQPGTRYRRSLARARPHRPSSPGDVIEVRWGSRRRDRRPGGRARADQPVPRHQRDRAGEGRSRRRAPERP